MSCKDADNSIKSPYLHDINKMIIFVAGSWKVTRTAEIEAGRTYLINNNVISIPNDCLPSFYHP